MKWIGFSIITLAIALASSAQAIESALQIMACGTVQVSTNTAQPGTMGAAVVTTYLTTSKNVFKLQAATAEEANLISRLVDGQKVTFIGITMATLDATGAHQIQRNSDGSINLALRLVVPGCQ